MNPIAFLLTYPLIMLILVMIPVGLLLKVLRQSQLIHELQQTRIHQTELPSIVDGDDQPDWKAMVLPDYMDVWHVDYTANNNNPHVISWGGALTAQEAKAKFDDAMLQLIDPNFDITHPTRDDLRYFDGLGDVYQLHDGSYCAIHTESRKNKYLVFRLFGSTSAQHAQSALQTFRQSPYKFPQGKHGQWDNQIVDTVIQLDYNFVPQFDDGYEYQPYQQEFVPPHRQTPYPVPQTPLRDTSPLYSPPQYQNGQYARRQRQEWPHQWVPMPETGFNR